MNFRQIPIFVAALLALAPPSARAWGVQGHEVVALIALREMTPAARAQVAHLLGSQAMLVHQANWADEIRDQRSDTGPWHYVNIPLPAAGYEPRRDCPARACVVAQIENDLRILGNRKLGDGVRAEALRFLVHFTADVHQPLHAGDNHDRGGNDVQIRLGQKRTNLHRVWDADLVEVLGPDAAAVANRIEASLSPAQRKAWASGTPASWATESHAIARDQIRPALAGRRQLRLPRDYAERQAPLTRMLLAKAGLRLAWLLNTVLK